MKKKALIKLALAKESEGFKIIPHIGGASLGRAEELGRWAKERGASILAAVTPYYYEWNFKSILQYYRGLEKIGLPLLLYDIPKYSGISLPADELKRLAGKINMVALKESTTDKKRLEDFLPLKERLSLLVGTDSLIDWGLKVGYSGCVSAISNFLPELVAKIYQLALNKKWEQASALQSKLNSIRSFLKRRPSIMSIKKAMELRGLFPGRARKPFPTFSKKGGKEFLAELRKLLKKEGINREI